VFKAHARNLTKAGVNVHQPKILCIFGTRPEAIKMAPVLKALEPGFQPVAAVTAQHRGLLDQVLELFDLEPRYDLNIMEPGQSLEQITARSLTGLSGILAQEKPAAVLVHGDTTTTFAGALAAFYAQIPVGHVEAGLRTYNKYSPFPEEINRRLTGVLTDLHLAPTLQAKTNLVKEGISPAAVYVTGNTVIDALLQVVDPAYRLPPPLDAIDFSRRTILVTAHRRENWGAPLEQVFLAVRDLIRAFEDLQVVYPVHPNPRVREPARTILGGEPRALLLDPLEYRDFANLMARSYLVLTDSGGLQEEAPALGKPVLVLRDTTERPEALDAGTVRLAGTSRDTVYREASRLLSDEKAYRAMAGARNPYGDGKAARRTAAALRHFLGLTGQRPADFVP